MDDPLTPDEAARIVGVPTHQLRAWAWDRVGPRHVGTRLKPLYHEQDLREWMTQRGGDHARD